MNGKYIHLFMKIPILFISVNSCTLTFIISYECCNKAGPLGWRNITFTKSLFSFALTSNPPLIKTMHIISWKLNFYIRWTPDIKRTSQLVAVRSLQSSMYCWMVNSSWHTITLILFHRTLHKSTIQETPQKPLVPTVLQIHLKNNNYIIIL